MKKIFVTIVLALSYVAAYCIPAKPGLMRINDKYGQTVEVFLRGDENMHYYETLAGNILLRTADDEFRYAELSTEGKVIFGETFNPGTEQVKPSASILKALAGEGNERNAAAHKVAPGPVPVQFPTIGESRCLVILAEYPDVSFTPAATKEYFEAKINQIGYSDDRTCGSVRDYFLDQSSGKYAPFFDVVGPITLPHERSWYGLNEDIENHVRDACLEVDKNWDVDFSQYDSDGDGFVDFVAVIYAGHGEAQGGPAECFWPAMKDLSNSVYDIFDGKYLSRAFCSCELAGGEGDTLDGIGTFVHEYSHVLGLPDIYDTSQYGGYGMGHYDIMCFGPYNEDGCYPCGYTALDRYSVGWLEPEVLEGSVEDVELESLSSSNKAFFIVNPSQPNEYYTLENRQAEKWDIGLPGHGLVISYVNYDSRLWKGNTVNALRTSSYEHVRIVAADGRWATGDNEAGDVFPGNTDNTSFTDDSYPAAIWYSDKSTPVAQPVTNIRQDESGKILFDFGESDSGVDGVVADESVPIQGGKGCVHAPDGSRVFNIYGVETGRDNLSPGIYIVTAGGKSLKVSVK